MSRSVPSPTKTARCRPTGTTRPGGQVCVADGYRGQRLLDRMYQHYRSLYCDRHQLLITDISAPNPRSIRVYERIGFQLLQRFYEPTVGEE